MQLPVLLFHFTRLPWHHVILYQHVMVLLLCAAILKLGMNICIVQIRYLAEFICARRVCINTFNVNIVYFVFSFYVIKFI